MCIPCISDKLWNAHRRLYSSRNKGSLGKPTLLTTDSSLQEASEMRAVALSLWKIPCVSGVGLAHCSSSFGAIWEFRGNMNSWAFHNILIVIAYFLKHRKREKIKSKQKCVHRSIWISYQIDLSQMSHIHSKEKT